MRTRGAMLAWHARRGGWRVACGVWRVDGRPVGRPVTCPVTRNHRVPLFVSWEMRINVLRQAQDERQTDGSCTNGQWIIHDGSSRGRTKTRLCFTGIFTPNHALPVTLGGPFGASFRPCKQIPAMPAPHTRPWFRRPLSVACGSLGAGFRHQKRGSKGELAMVFCCFPR